MKITVSTKLDEKLKEKLKRDATRGDRTLSQEIARRLKKSYERK